MKNGNEKLKRNIKTKRTYKTPCTDCIVLPMCSKPCKRWLRLYALVRNKLSHKPIATSFSDILISMMRPEVLISVTVYKKMLKINTKENVPPKLLVHRF
jgi:hypothetical protein